MSDMAEARWHAIQFNEKRREQHALADAIAERLAARLNTSWIPATEAWPDVVTDALVTVRAVGARPARTQVGRYDPSLVYKPEPGRCWFVDGELADVIAWMPFPRPYMEGRHGT